MTASFVDADCAAACGTGPSCFFFFKKLSDTVLFNGLEVFNHAHAVPGPVSPVQMVQPVAGEFTALKTIFFVAFLKRLAVFDLAYDTGYRFAGIGTPAAGAFVFIPEIGHADTAVHAAWCYEIRNGEELHGTQDYNIYL